MQTINLPCAVPTSTGGRAESLPDVKQDSDWGTLIVTITVVCTALSLLLNCPCVWDCGAARILHCALQVPVCFLQITSITGVARA